MHTCSVFFSLSLPNLYVLYIYIYIYSEVGILHHTCSVLYVSQLTLLWNAIMLPTFETVFIFMIKFVYYITHCYYTLRDIQLIIGIHR